MSSYHKSLEVFLWPLKERKKLMLLNSQTPSKMVQRLHIKQEGFVTIDRRRGAIVSLDVDKMRAIEEMKRNLQVILAEGRCRNISCQEVHQLVDEIFSEYE